jgi:tyrosine-specific transport protein
LKNPFIQTLGNLFALITLTTSYLGISLGFIDFLADGLKLSHRGFPRFWLCCAIFVLPFLISLINPALFLEALGYAGGIGVALLLGLMPILMIWNVRYRRRGKRAPHQLPGGKPLLALMLAFTLLVVLLETL